MENGKIIVGPPCFNENQIRIDFKVSEDLNQYFLSNQFIFKSSIPLDGIPESIAVIPLVVQLLPIIWLTDSELKITSLDENFYLSIPDFKEGYKKMYPMLNFNGKLSIKSLEKSQVVSPQKENIAALFSGGLDAYSTVLSHFEDKPTLIAIQGADIPFEDTKGWIATLSKLTEASRQLNLPLITIQSNFAAILNHIALNNLVRTSNDNWWHGFQHGIGMLGLAAPISFLKNIDILYIASSYTKRDKVPCASHPNIDNNMRFNSTIIYHDQYEFNRFEKTKNIINKIAEFNLDSPFLRVCYINKSGDNCCKCEKCIRTATALSLLGANPQQYGFNDKKVLQNSKTKVILNISYSTIPLWEDMQEAIKKYNIQLPKDLKWLQKTNFKKSITSIKVRGLKFLCRKSKRCRSLILN